MKPRVKNLIGYTLGATDGEIGKVKDFYFDDQKWTIRYLVVKTGNWLSGRKVLISPEALLTPNHKTETFPVNLTRERVKNSPNIDTDKPISREHEIQLYKHYAWKNYWLCKRWMVVGTTGMIMPMPAVVDPSIEKKDNKPEEDTHLRSTEKVKSYGIKVNDGEISDVKDFIVDDTNWKIDFMIIDTGNWFPEKEMLISTNRIKEINWETSTVIVDAPVDTIKNIADFESAPVK